MKEEIRIGIVVVNYNGERFQNDCVKSILASSYTNFLLIIVDNASSDKSMEKLGEFEDDRIVKIYNSQNYGVAKGNNIGIKESIRLGCQATLLLNNDTVVDPEAISILAHNLKSHKVIVPKILFYDSKKIWYLGGHFSSIKGTAVHDNYEKDNGEPFSNFECDYAPTCCMLIDNTVFDKVGIMDENYFIYFDDTDFCFRLKLANYRILAVPDALILHKVSSTTGGDKSKIYLYYANRNRLYFINKFKKSFGCFTSLFVYASRYFKVLFGNKKESNYIRLAIKDYKKGIMGCVDLP